MSNQISLQEYAESLREEVDSQSGEKGGFWMSTFTRLLIERLTDLAVLEGGEDCYGRGHGIEVYGYYLDNARGRLDLFTCIRAERAPASVIGQERVKDQFQRLINFVDRSMRDYHEKIERSSALYPLVRKIHDLSDRIETIRFFLFTDGQVKNIKDGGRIRTTKDTLKQRNISFDIWDIVRLHRCETIGQQSDPIGIDLQAEFGTEIECLATPEAGEDCRVFLACIPAGLLAGMYERYGIRLLERNVRAFLQVRGKVNQGIRKTIKETPHRFLAYNNGISATADQVEIKSLPNGVRCIHKIHNLQIVNGGQTTATIHYTHKNDGHDLAGVYVQMKLTVVEPDLVETVVPLISRYANSQNKVSDSDFFASHPVQIQLEKLSRTTLTPAAGDATIETRWFYERVRGGFMYEKGRAKTAADKRQFDALCPANQKITKTDLAKYVNSWDQFPHFVSLGAQKNFDRFMGRVQKEPELQSISRERFQEFIAMAILFRQTDRMVQDMEVEGYKANIVTYTVAYLSHRTMKRIDLRRIWTEQGITPALRESIQDVAKTVEQAITNRSDSQNITEWCKSPRCWDEIKRLDIPLGRKLTGELRPASSAGAPALAPV